MRVYILRQLLDSDQDLIQRIDNGIGISYHGTEFILTVGSVTDILKLSVCKQLQRLINSGNRLVYALADNYRDDNRKNRQNNTDDYHNKSRPLGLRHNDIIIRRHNDHPTR